MTNLSAANVHDIILKCLFGPTEKTDGAIIAHGAKLKIGFDPARLEKHKEAIAEMLLQLPNEFMLNGGGGMSFLNAAHDKEGNQWTDLHHTIDELICLGLAIDKVGFNMPRAFWQAMPGGMPYFYVKN